MPLAESYPKMTPGEYLAWEEKQLEKHEYVAGEIFCHAGARKDHNLVAGNIFAELRAALKGSPCQAYIADMRVQINAADCYFYPDVVVTCSALDSASELYLEHPSFIAEVLSDSTAAWDQGGKFELYRTIPELQEYMVVDPDHRSIQLYRKTDAGSWMLIELHGVEAIRLESLGVTIVRNEIIPEEIRHD
jgi:Uma2 family endonuclease